jgi:predicted nucleic acid-binding Zn ribbon protein
VKRRRSRFPRTKRAVDAAEALGSVIDHYKLGGRIRERRVLTEWREIVGDRIAARTWPGRVRDGVLAIRVSNSAWMHELSFLKDQITDKLRERTGGLVTEIRFWVGSPRADQLAELKRADRARRRPAPEHTPPELTPATGPELERIEAETESVTDDELRAIIREARRKLNL